MKAIIRPKASQVVNPRNVKSKIKICQVTNDRTIKCFILVIYLEFERVCKKFVKKSVDTNRCHVYFVFVLKKKKQQKIYKSISIEKGENIL